MKIILKKHYNKNTVGKSILTNATYKHSLNESVVVEKNDKNPPNVSFETLKETINVNPLSANSTKLSIKHTEKVREVGTLRVKNVRNGKAKDM